MRVLFLLLALGGVALSIYTHGPLLSLPLLGSTLLVVVAVLLLFLRPGRDADIPWIIVDGSNVMYWDRETPSLATVRHVLEAIEAEGLVPLVWFDANVGYLTAGQYLRPLQLSRMLGLHHGQVAVAPKGTPADPLLLEAAARMGARVVTNDRFRDWAEDHPAVREAGFLVGGAMQGGKVTLRLGERVKVG